MDKIKADLLVELHNKEASYSINHLCEGGKNPNVLALGIAQRIQEAVSKYAH